MNISKTESGHDDLQLLLPWYVNNTLSPDEHERVSRHVAKCQECREHVALLEQVQKEATRSPAVPIVQPDFDAVLEAIDSRQRIHESRSRFTGLAVAASIAAAVIASALIFSDLETGTDEETRFQTATGTHSDSTFDYVMTLTFESAVAPDDQHRVLQDLNVIDATPTNGDSSFRVVVSLPVTSLERLEQYARDIERREEIESVSIDALQLPLR